MSEVKTHSSLPMVSVIIPTHNRYQLVCRAIESVLMQSYENIECLVIDDASTDETVPQLRKKYPNKIVLLQNETNKEKSYTRNKGVYSSSGEFVCFLDSDDTLTIDSIKSRIECFTNDPLFDGVSFGLRRRAGKKSTSINSSEMVPSNTKLSLDEYLKNRSWLSNNSFLLRKDKMTELGMYNVDLLVRGDQELLIRLLSVLEFRFCGSVVTEIFEDATLRARTSFEKIIKQRDLFTATLEGNPIVYQQLGPWLQKLKIHERSEVLRSLYQSKQFKEYRAEYLLSLKEGLAPISAKFIKRFILSYLKML